MLITKLYVKQAHGYRFSALPQKEQSLTAFIRNESQCSSALDYNLIALTNLHLEVVTCSSTSCTYTMIEEFCTCFEPAI